MGKNAGWLGTEVPELWGSITPKPDGARTAGELARLSARRNPLRSGQLGYYTPEQYRGTEA